MDYSERDEALRSGEFVGRCRVALCDWAEYWAVNGTESIEDPELRHKTNLFLNFFLDNPEAYLKKVVHLAIAEPSVRDAAEITDGNVAQAVTVIMSHALDYLM